MMPIGGRSFDEGVGCIIRGNVGPESADVAKDAAAVRNEQYADRAADPPGR
jgi:hypothetical protein